MNDITSFSEETIALIHSACTKAALEASEEFALKYFGGKNNDRGACGFAWVEYHPRAKGNTRVGKAERRLMETIGFSKDWDNKWTLWNPSTWRGQSVDAKYTGAEAYANTFMGLTGVKLIARDRLD